MADGNVPTLLAARLSPAHLEALRVSGISDEAIADRGYTTVQAKVRLSEFGFGRAQQRVPALLIPLHSVHGEIASYQCRPDSPRMRNGRMIKYETPKGSGMVLDVPPCARGWLGDPERPIFITEGAKKADSAATRGLCCIALLGVWNWRGSNPQGGKTVLADFEAVALNGRRVYLAFDSDAAEKLGVRMALGRLANFVQSRGAEVRIVHLPSGPGGAKAGLDDYLAAGHSVDDVLRLATEDLPAADDEGPYLSDERGMFWLRPTEDGPVQIPLANFAAAIRRDVLQDDGLEQHRSFEIAAEQLGRMLHFRVPADRFASMSWVSEHLGARALVYPGYSIRDHLRAAIQTLSEPEASTTYTHTGWRYVNGRHVYLHGGGAIGENGVVPDVEVELPEVLAPCVLPLPPTGAELCEAVRGSLRVLDIQCDELAFPLLAATYCAALGGTDFSLFMTGETGVLKTAFAAVLQQHYGGGFDARHLPGSWSSTENALEDIAFTGKDVLLVVDDFVSQPSEASRLHARAERVLRAQGNRSARLRMRADGTIRPPRPPRGLILRDCPQITVTVHGSWLVAVGGSCSSSRRGTRGT